MSYAISCECGRQLTVQATDAGTHLPCSCGRQVKVPTLGRLARAAGEPMRTLSASEKVRVLVAAGELPTGTTCVRCQFPTDGVLECSVECERPYTKKRLFWEGVLVYLFAPLWFSMVAKSYYDKPEVHGRETLVKTPLRVCGDCQQRFRGGAHSSELWQLLNSVPEYAALLQAFPSAHVVAIVKTNSTAR